MKFKTNAEGQLVLTEEEFTGAVKEASDAAAEAAVAKLIKDLKLDVAQPLPGAAQAPDEKRFMEPSGPESRHDRAKRIGGALAEIKLGKMRVEYAPKEIKMVRFINAQANGDKDVVKTLSEGVAADGGNLVPIEFSTDVFVAIEEYGVMRRDAYGVPMTSNEIDLRTVTTKPVVSRKAELIASDESSTKFGKPQLRCDMYTGKQVMSRELFDDNNVGLYQRLVDLFAEQFGYAEDVEGLVNSYYPGVLSSTTPTNTPIAGASIADVKYKELVKFKNSLSKGKLARGGKFYMHRTIFSLFEGMEDQQGRPVISNPFGVTPPTLLGYPVELTEVMPDISTDAANKGFIIFGNLNWVAMGKRAGLTMETLREGTLTIAGGGSVNLADQRAYGLVMDTRWGFNVTIPSNIAVLKTP